MWCVGGTRVWIVAGGSWQAIACPTRNMLEQEHPRLLQRVLERTEELGGRRAVDDPVVARERDGQRRAGDDLPVADHGPLLGGPDGEDADLRRVDDRAELADPERAEAADRERAAGALVALEAPGA